MDIKEIRAITQMRLAKELKEGTAVFEKLICGDKEVYVSYADTTGFHSVLYKIKDKTYLFIDNKMSEKDKKAEIKFVLRGDGLHYYSKEENEEMRKVAKKVELKKMQFKLINYDDVENIMNNVMFGEYLRMREFAEKVEELANIEYEPETNNKYATMLYMFKLGVMQGKREERTKRKRHTQLLNKTLIEEREEILNNLENLLNRKPSIAVRNKMLSVLDGINNMSAEAQEIVNLEIELDKKIERLKEVQLKGGASNEC
ncbi:hypothetical protein [uncultured Clostridium sp.]|uniref:hypothetical protein n=1 Tax=uncultured Clostridium sp. TaxID=59620 RepID=UPI0025FC8477|nr:hypothetical protein [uncultured Clostridium sp.]